MLRMCLVAVAVLSCFGATPAHATKRSAFVVGVDTYDYLGPDKQLQRAVNDARSVSRALAALGFNVRTIENVTRGRSVLNGSTTLMASRPATVWPSTFLVMELRLRASITYSPATYRTSPSDGRNRSNVRA